MRSRDRGATYLAVGAIAITAIAVGGALRVTAAVAALAALAAYLPYVRSTRTFTELPPLLLFLGCAAILTGLQLIPLPAAVVAFLSPEIHQTVVDARGLLGGSVAGWMPLSADPAATLVELAKLTAYCVFAAACLMLCASGRSARRALVQGITVIGLAIGAVALAHFLLGARKLYGVYVPRDYSPRFLAPLINPNHLSGVMAVTSCLAAGLSLDARTREAAAAWAASAIFAAGMCLAVNSRGGLVALAVGGAALAVLRLLRARTASRQTPQDNARRTLSIGAAGAVAVAILGSVALASGVAGDMSNTELNEFRDPNSKFGAWSSTRSVVSDHRWTGIGRGAYETVFTRYHPQSSARIYSHAENEYLQTIVDWGLPGALLLFLALGATVRSALKRWRNSGLTAGALAGLACIAVHDIADFSLQLPVVAMSAIALFAVATHVPLQRRKSHRAKRLGARTAAVTCGAALAALALTQTAASAREDAAALVTYVGQEDHSARAVARAGRRAMRRHPADFYAPLVTAQALYQRGSPEAIAFAAQSMRLHPTHAGTHQLTARILFRAGRRDQALLEYGLAIEHARNPRQLMEEVTSRFHDDRELIERLPSAPESAMRLYGHLRRAKRHRAGVLLARRVLALEPNHAATHFRMAQLLMESDQPHAAAVAAKRAYELAPNSRHAVLLATALVGDHNPDEAEEVLTRVGNNTADRRELVEIRESMAQVYLAQSRPAKAKEVMKSVLEMVSQDPLALARAHDKLAEIERLLGNEHRAHWEEERARRLRKTP